MGKKKIKLLFRSARSKPRFMNFITMRLFYKMFGKVQVVQYVIVVPGLGKIVNPVISYILKNVLHLGPITDILDLRALFL